MRVTDWQKWTSFKKKVTISSWLIGLIFGFCIEEGGMGYIIPALSFTALSAIVLYTIERDEWLPQESSREQYSN
jgi:hypothetical protein